MCAVVVVMSISLLRLQASGGQDARLFHSLHITCLESAAENSWLHTPCTDYDLVLVILHS